MIVGILSFFVIYILLNVYIGLHGYHLLIWGGHDDWTLAYWMLFSLVALSYIISRIPFIRGKLQHFFQWIGSWYIAVFFFSLLTLPPINLLHLLLVNVAEISKPISGWMLASIWGLFLAGLFVIGYRNARNPVVRTYPISFSKWHATRIGGPKMKILMVSDLHLGHLVGKGQLLKLLEIARAMKPDLILLPGDVVDDDPQAFLDMGMSQIMQQIVAVSRLGAYAVLGNHEYYGRQINRYVSIMTEIGVTILQDEVVKINVDADRALYLIGRKDYTVEQFAGAKTGADLSTSTGRLSVVQLTAEIDRSIPWVMMDHQPRQFDLAQDAGVNLLLCGHTHRGQFVPNHWITRRLFELDWGYLKKGHMHVLVSSGFGTWGPPMRLASRSEVLEIIIE